jgi:hypothetical protein
MGHIHVKMGNFVIYCYYKLIIMEDIISYILNFELIVMEYL